MENTLNTLIEKFNKLADDRDYFVPGELAGFSDCSGRAAFENQEGFKEWLGGRSLCPVDGENEVRPMLRLFASLSAGAGVDAQDCMSKLMNSRLAYQSSGDSRIVAIVFHCIKCLHGRFPELLAPMCGDLNPKDLSASQILLKYYEAALQKPRSEMSDNEKLTVVKVLSFMEKEDGFDRFDELGLNLARDVRGPRIPAVKAFYYRCLIDLISADNNDARALLLNCFMRESIDIEILKKLNLFDVIKFNGFTKGKLNVQRARIILALPLALSHYESSDAYTVLGRLRSDKAFNEKNIKAWFKGQVHSKYDLDKKVLIGDMVLKVLISAYEEASVDITEGIISLLGTAGGYQLKTDINEDTARNLFPACVKFIKACHPFNDLYYPALRVLLAKNSKILRPAGFDVQWMYDDFINRVNPVVTGSLLEGSGGIVFGERGAKYFVDLSRFLFELGTPEQQKCISEVFTDFVSRAAKVSRLLPEQVDFWFEQLRHFGVGQKKLLDFLLVMFKRIDSAKGTDWIRPSHFNCLLYASTVIVDDFNHSELVEYVLNFISVLICHYHSEGYVATHLFNALTGITEKHAGSNAGGIKSLRDVGLSDGVDKKLMAELNLIDSLNRDYRPALAKVKSAALYSAFIAPEGSEVRKTALEVLIKLESKESLIYAMGLGVSEDEMNLIKSSTMRHPIMRALTDNSIIGLSNKTTEYLLIKIGRDISQIVAELEQVVEGSFSSDSLLALIKDAISLLPSDHSEVMLPQIIKVLDNNIRDLKLSASSFLFILEGLKRHLQADRMLNLYCLYFSSVSPLDLNDPEKRRVYQHMLSFIVNDFRIKEKITQGASGTLSKLAKDTISCLEVLSLKGMAHQYIRSTFHFFLRSSKAFLPLIAQCLSERGDELNIVPSQESFLKDLGKVKSIAIVMSVFAQEDLKERAKLKLMEIDNRPDSPYTLHRAIVAKSEATAEIKLQECSVSGTVVRFSPKCLEYHALVWTREYTDLNWDIALEQITSSLEKNGAIPAPDLEDDRVDSAKYIEDYISGILMKPFIRDHLNRSAPKDEITIGVKYIISYILSKLSSEETYESGLISLAMFSENIKTCDGGDREAIDITVGMLQKEDILRSQAQPNQNAIKIDTDIGKLLLNWRRYICLGHEHAFRLGQLGITDALVGGFKQIDPQFNTHTALAVREVAGRELGLRSSESKPIFDSGNPSCRDFINSTSKQEILNAFMELYTYIRIQPLLIGLLHSNLKKVSNAGTTLLSSGERVSLSNLFIHDALEVLMSVAGESFNPVDSPEYFMNPIRVPLDLDDVKDYNDLISLEKGDFYWAFEGVSSLGMIRIMHKLGYILESKVDSGDFTMMLDDQTQGFGDRVQYVANLSRKRQRDGSDELDRDTKRRKTER